MTHFRRELKGSETGVKVKVRVRVKVKVKVRVKVKLRVNVKVKVKVKVKVRVKVKLRVKVKVRVKVRVKVKVNVKFSFPLEQAMKAQKGSRGIVILSFFKLDGRWGWSVSATPLSLTPGERDGIPVVHFEVRHPRCVEQITIW